MIDIFSDIPKGEGVPVPRKILTLLKCEKHRCAEFFALHKSRERSLDRLGSTSSVDLKVISSLIMNYEPLPLSSCHIVLCCVMCVVLCRLCHFFETWWFPAERHFTLLTLRGSPKDSCGYETHTA